MKKYTRSCPNCDIVLVYKTYHAWWVATKKNTTCISCCQKGRTAHNRINDDELIRTCPRCHGSLRYTNRTSFLRARRSNARCRRCGSNTTGLMKRGEKRTSESIKKFQETVTESGVLFTRPPHTERTKAKIRETKLRKYAEKSQLYHGCVNPVACDYMDQLNIKNGWNLVHGKNGGEHTICGYKVDGYDKARNIVVEYDEPHHYPCGILRNKDVIRQERIVAASGCEFWRYDSKNDILYKVPSKKLDTSAEVPVI